MLKLEIVWQCYPLGSRSLSAILSTSSSDIDGLRQYLGSLVAERTGITDTKKLIAKRRNFMCEASQHQANNQEFKAKCREYIPDNCKLHKSGTVE